MNPYAPPKAHLEEIATAGAAWRDGKLVRIDREGALPARCVVCNAPAGKRIPRTLYWSPAAWRYFSSLAPFGLLVAGLLLGLPWITLLFWPAVVALGIAHYFVRKKLVLELGVCPRHSRQRTVLRTLSIASLVGIVAVFATLPPVGGMQGTLLVVLVAAIAVLALVQVFVGVQAVSVRKLDRAHAWLGGTGADFRAALPELPRA